MVLVLGFAVTVASSLLLTGNAFVPSPSTSFFQLEQPQLGLFMVSKKEKRRLQQGQERGKTFERLDLIKAQKTLALQLQALLSKGSSTAAARQANKLLKNSLHDGLIDIGSEARFLALEVFYRAERPSDMADLVSGNAGTNPNLLDHFGLWAYSMLEDWTSAVTYADRLYISDNPSASESSVFFKQKEQDQLRQFVIQAFANTDQNVHRAMKLLNLTSSSVATTTTVNALLRSHQRNRNLTDFKTLFQKVLQLSSSTADAGHEILDGESFGLALESAAQLGDIALMEQALGDKQSVWKAIQDDGNITILERALLDASAKRPSPRKTLTCILETLAKAASTGKLQQEYQTLARMAIQLQLRPAKKQKADRFPVQPEVLSQIFVAFDNNTLDLERSIHSCLLFGSGTKNNHRQPWDATLSVPAKVRIFPVLAELGPTPTSTSATKNTSKLDDNSDAWKLLTSLLTINKNGTVSPKGREFLREQSYEFCVTASSLRRNHKDGPEVWPVILQECWKTLLYAPDEQQGRLHTNTCVVVKQMMANIPYLPEETMRIDLFDKIVSELRQKVLLQLSRPILPTKEGDITTVNDDEAAGPPTFANEKLNVIVHGTVSLLRAIAKSASSPASSSCNDKDNQQQLRQQLAVKVSEAAMQLVAGLEEFSSDHFWHHGPSDGAKEALQAIMKELLVSVLLTNDDDLVQPACQYYFSLARVSRSSANIGYLELFFPASAWRELGKSRDPWQDFRDCVVGGGKSKKSGNLWLNAVQSVLEMAQGDLHMLLQSLLCMTLESDQHTGGTSHQQFVLKYKDFFINGRKDLFFDKELLSQLCSAMDLAATIGPLEDARSWFQSLFTSDFAQVMIVRLETCEDARYWIVDTMCNMDSEGKIDVSAEFLVHLYAQAGVFYKLLDDDNFTPLGKAYIKACGMNARCLVEACASKSSLRPDGRAAKKFTSRKRRRPELFGIEALAWMLRHISNIATPEEIAESPKIDDEDYGMTSCYSILIKHVLTSFFEFFPAETQETCLRLISDNGLELNLQVLGFIETWYDKFLKVPE